MPAPEPAKILVVRAGRAGDLVMITPALRLLLDRAPEAQIHLLTTAEGRRVLKGFDPRLSRSHLYHRRFPEDLFARPRLETELRRERYERVYLFESNPHYRTLVAGTAPRVFGLAERPAGEIVHYCVRCLESVERSFPAPRAGAHGWITLPVTEEGRASADRYLAAHGVAAGGSPGGVSGGVSGRRGASRELLVGLHPRLRDAGIGWLANRDAKHREWPLASFAALVRMLVEHGRGLGMSVRVIVDLLPEERRRAGMLVQAAGDALTVLSGPPDFERYKALLEKLDLLVTPNTGPMHIAAAVGTPVVALFSRWSPAECGPFVPADRYAILRAEETREPERGLAAISPEDVLDRCGPFLSRAAGGAVLRGC